MKRRSFFQRVLGAFGAAIVADKVVAKNDVVPNTTITGTQGMYVTPTVTPSITPSVTPSGTWTKSRISPSVTPTRTTSVTPS